MRKIHVDLQENAYDIYMERGLLKKAGTLLSTLIKGDTIAIITDTRVDALYGQMLQQSLEGSGYTVHRIAFPEGEPHKTLHTLQDVYEALSHTGITRKDTIITLGGGVPGDLGGLAAATYLRGIPFIQIPTTLLAQIDSSVGGKVAVDLDAGKNLVGAFYQPTAVLIDPDLLATLDPRFLRDGLAEAVKYGCIREPALFDRFANMSSPEEAIGEVEDIIEICCNCKARIVEHDEKDLGERMLLNFGHTLGHAIETHTGYGTYTHGEGVGIGMVLITEAAERHGLTPLGTADKIRKVLQSFHLPTEINVSNQTLLRYVGKDKKRQGASISLIILKEIGEGTILSLPMEELETWL